VPSSRRLSTHGLLFFAATVGCGSPEGASEEVESNEAAVVLTPGEPAEAPSFPAGYESWTARQKQAYVWSWLAKSEYCGAAGDETNGDRPNDYWQCPSPLPTGGGVLWSVETFIRVARRHRLTTTFDRSSSDEMPGGRPKLIHAFGSVAKIEFALDPAPPPSNPWIAPEHRRPYTGLVAPGQVVSGIARLSLAGLTPSFSPGIAVKLFVDGRESANFQAMFRIDGQGDDKNFFANAFSNEVPPPAGFAGQALDAVFKTVKRDSTFLPVTALGRYAVDGSEDPSPRSPRTLSLVPTPEVHQRISSSTTEDFRIGLRWIPPGTALYDVYASDARNDRPVHIGTIRTASYLIASAHGDAELFFRHGR
jgi:hypothetical protein